MCRLLYVCSPTPFRLKTYLQPFARIARQSKEYQGDGWGCAFWEGDQWRLYKSTDPIWEDDAAPVMEKQSSVLVAHARSAFRDGPVDIRHNMPFIKDNLVFIFNGELHGVRIREEGVIGAEKIFNFILRFLPGRSPAEALAKATAIIEKRSKYVKAMNIILADRNQACLSSLFNEDEDYFTMHIKRQNGRLIICSDPFIGESGWQKIDNRSGGVYSC